MAAYELYDGNGNMIETREASQTKEEINAPILAQLAAIDVKSTRALREGDATRIADLESLAASLRAGFVK